MKTFLLAVLFGLVIGVQVFAQATSTKPVLDFNLINTEELPVFYVTTRLHDGTLIRQDVYQKYEDSGYTYYKVDSTDSKYTHDWN